MQNRVIVAVSLDCVTPNRGVAASTDVDSSARVSIVSAKEDQVC